MALAIRICPLYIPSYAEDGPITDSKDEHTNPEIVKEGLVSPLLLLHFLFCFLFFETGFLCVTALAVLELAL